jgi:large subunit ribosomal protein L19e
MKNASPQKKLAARVMHVGVSRVRIIDDKEVEEAITRNDVRRLVVRGVIAKSEKRGTSKKYSSYRLSQKKKGRRIGKGSWKGRKFAKKDSKSHWIDRIRPLRRLLKELRDSGKIERHAYRKLYYQVKGGAFRNKKHLLYHLKSKELIKAGKGVKSEKK